MDVVTPLQKAAVQGTRVKRGGETVGTWNQGTATTF